MITEIRNYKKIYGDTFSCVAEEWGEFLGIKVSPEDVANMLSRLNKCKSVATETKLVDAQKALNGAFAQTKRIDSLAFTNAHNDMRSLMYARNDTLIKAQNYKWIADNFEEYKKI